MNRPKANSSTKILRSKIYVLQNKPMTVAKKTNPALWERAKKAACSKGGLCKHSARKMQWATRYYKQHGGRYSGKRRADNSLTQWGKQKWRTSSGKKSGGRLRYLPDAAWRKLTASEKRRTNAAKKRGYARGKQYVRQPKDIARKTRRSRTSTKKRRTKQKRTRRSTQKVRRRPTQVRRRRRNVSRSSSRRR